MLEQVTVTYPTGVVWTIQPKDVTEETLGEVFNCAGETGIGQAVLAGYAYDNIMAGPQARHVYDTMQGPVVITRHKPTVIDKAGLRPLAKLMAHPDVHTAIVVISAALVVARILYLCESGL